MRLFGFEITRAKAAPVLSAIHANTGWFGLIREPFAGAWQRNMETDAPRDLLAFSALFSCTTLIESDISKLRIKLVEEDANGICTEIRSNAYTPVLSYPNHFQTRIQFLGSWVLSKLMHGNTYVLKGRDARRVVTSLYVLDPSRVTPLVAENGEVYYQLSRDDLSGLPDAITVPASEIIHDRWHCLWHPLVGVSPIYAAGVAATQGRRIQGNSSKFFDNMSRPSGVLTAPGAISDETATRLKQAWDENFSGGNMGRTAVVGDGLKYEAMTIPAEQSQLIQQLDWTAKDVAIAFHVPLYKIGGPKVAGDTVESLNNIYYSDCLQVLIEAIELCLDEGLKLPETYYTELDLDGLLRMDQSAMANVEEKLMGAGIKAPDESRKRFNLKAVPGGKVPYLQQQNYSLEALSKRDALADPFGTAPKPAAPAEPEDDEDEMPEMDEAANDDMMEQAAALLTYIDKKYLCAAQT